MKVSYNRRLVNNPQEKTLFAHRQNFLSNPMTVFQTTSSTGIPWARLSLRTARTCSLDSAPHAWGRPDGKLQVGDDTVDHLIIVLRRGETGRLDGDEHLGYPILVRPLFSHITDRVAPESIAAMASNAMDIADPFQYPMGRNRWLSSMAAGSSVRFPSLSYPPGNGSFFPCNAVSSSFP
jgi:hypothetical protein